MVNSKEISATPVVVIDNEELNFEEERDRLRLERQVERAFYQAGIALKELRERRLYRSTHKTFQEYCQDRFGFTRSHPYRLIDAAIVIDNLAQMSPNGGQNNSQSDTSKYILPTNERQCRPLTKLEPEKQREVWHKAIELNGGKVPSGKIVSQLVSQIQGKSPKVSCPPKNAAKELSPEGLVYTQGLGIEYNVRLSQETWSKLNEYAVLVGTATLDGAISRLLMGVKIS